LSLKLQQLHGNCASQITFATGVITRTRKN